MAGSEDGIGSGKRAVYRSIRHHAAFFNTLRD
jgi:hypothetical protein